MQDKLTICIAATWNESEIEELISVLQTAWPSPMTPDFCHRDSSNAQAVLVLANNQQELCGLFPRIAEFESNHIPIIVASKDIGELTNLLNDIELINISIESSTETITGLLFGVIEKELHASQLRSQVQLMRQLQSTLRDDLCVLQNELETAAQIQREFMSYDLPMINGFTFDTFWQPAGVVSGDMYDIKRLDEYNVSFFISDSIGHGISAAMLAVMLNRTLSAHRFNPITGEITSPQEMMNVLNESMLHRTSDNARFATAIYGILNTKTNEFTFAGAGHPPALLSHDSGKATILESEGPLLGVFEDGKFVEETMQLHTGDSLIFYTDGFEHIEPLSDKTSCQLPKHLQAMHECCITQRDNLIEKIVSKTKSKKRAPIDDLTLIALKVNECNQVKLAA